MGAYDACTHKRTGLSQHYIPCKPLPALSHALEEGRLGGGLRGLGDAHHQLLQEPPDLRALLPVIHFRGFFVVFVGDCEFPCW